MTAYVPIADAGGNSAVGIRKVESSRSKAHRFRGANDGSWPIAEMNRLEFVAGKLPVTFPRDSPRRLPQNPSGRPRAGPSTAA